MNVRYGIPMLCAAALALAACGQSRLDRGVTGAGVGAGAGAAAGVVVGGLGAVPGALIGAGFGAATGLFTDEEDFSLGEPIWE